MYEKNYKIQLPDKSIFTQNYLFNIIQLVMPLRII